MRRLFELGLLLLLQVCVKAMLSLLKRRIRNGDTPAEAGKKLKDDILNGKTAIIGAGGVPADVKAAPALPKVHAAEIESPEEPDITTPKHYSSSMKRARISDGVSDDGSRGSKVPKSDCSLATSRAAVDLRARTDSIVHAQTSMKALKASNARVIVLHASCRGADSAAAHTGSSSRLQQGTARLAELAWFVNDGSGKRLEQHSYTVRSSSGRTVAEPAVQDTAAAAAAAAGGKPPPCKALFLGGVMDKLGATLQDHPSALYVAHNMDYNSMVLATEMLVSGRLATLQSWLAAKKHCIMLRGPPHSVYRASMMELLRKYYGRRATELYHRCGQGALAKALFAAKVYFKQLADGAPET